MVDLQTLMAAREYETSREEPQRFRLNNSTRNAGGQLDQTEDEIPKVVDLISCLGCSMKRCVRKSALSLLSYIANFLEFNFIFQMLIC